jgi:NADPH:quinone reductase-like Zn-dependent oxidoreductase
VGAVPIFTAWTLPLYPTYPTTGPDHLPQILVKVNSIALNPTDWKHIWRQLGAPGGISGCDYSGTVVKVGSGVTKAFSPGDRICGCAHGANQDEPFDGVFAEYAMVKGDVQMKIPDGLSFEQAATCPLGVATVAQGLYQKALKLNLPNNPTKSGEWVLIYGGSSATGSLGVQYAKLYVCPFVH